MQAVGSVMYFGMNMILMPFTATASTVWGAFYKLESFILMPIFGLNNGMVPIVAYNYGAGKRSRMVKTIRLSILYAVIIMLIGLAVFQLFPGLVLGMFSASDYMLEICLPVWTSSALQSFRHWATAPMALRYHCCDSSVYCCRWPTCLPRSAA